MAKTTLSSTNIGKTSSPKVSILTSTGIYPYDTGGPAVLLYHLYRNLVARHNLKVILLTRKKVKSDHIVSLIYAPLKSLDRLINSKVLIFNSPPMEAFLLLLLLRKLLNRKNIFIAHGGLFVEQKGFRTNIWKALLVKTLKKTRCIIVSPSYYMASFLSRLFSLESVVIHNCVDLKEIERCDSSIFPSKNNLIFVGLLRKIKDVQVLIRAEEKLLEHNLLCNLYIVGSGELEDQLKHYVARKKLSNYVYFLGRLDHRKVLSLIKGADILILSSYWENLPMVIIEAMACGKPVIATNVGGIPEVIEDGYDGILFPIQDSDALAKAVSLLMQNSQRAKKIGKAAKRTVEERFMIDTMIQKYLKVIEDCV